MVGFLFIFKRKKVMAVECFSTKIITSGLLSEGQTDAVVNLLQNYVLVYFQ